MKSNAGDIAEGIAKNAIDPGVPADSGGADGSSYTLETLRGRADNLKKAPYAGDISKASAKDTYDIKTVSSSKPLEINLRANVVEDPVAGIAAIGKAVCTIDPGVPAESVLGADVSSYAL